MSARPISAWCAIAIVALVSLGSCAKESDSPAIFVDGAEAAGLDFTYFNGMSGEHYFNEVMGVGRRSSTSTTTATWTSSWSRATCSVATRPLPTPSSHPDRDSS